MLSPDRDHSFICIINGFQCSSSDVRAEKNWVQQKAQLSNQNIVLESQVYLLIIALKCPTLILYVPTKEHLQNTLFPQIKSVSHWTQQSLCLYANSSFEMRAFEDGCISSLENKNWVEFVETLLGWECWRAEKGIKWKGLKLLGKITPC